MKRRMMRALMLLAGAGLLLPAMAGAWGTEEVETEKLAVKFAREVAAGGYGIVTTAELKQWMDAGKAPLVIDTMPYADSYAKQHIPGAVQFELPIAPLESLDAATEAQLRELLGPDKERLLVFYCGFTKCGRSHNGALWAKKLGYTNVYRCPGGIKAWEQAGFPVAKVTKEKQKEKKK